MSDDDVRTLVSIVAVLFTILNFVYARVAVSSALQERIKGIEEQTNNMNKQLDIHIRHLDGLRRDFNELTPKVDLFWDIIREHVPKMLLHPDDNRRDELLIKLSNNTLKHEEGVDLKAILENELEHYKRNPEIMGADPLAMLLPLALWALEEKLRQTGKDERNT